MAECSTGVSTSQLLSECRNTLYSDTENVGQSTMPDMMKSILNMIAEVNIRLTSIEKNTSALDEINEKLGNLSLRMDNSERDLEAVKRSVSGMENDLQGNSNIMDRVKAANDTIGRNVMKLKSDVEKLGKNENDVFEEIDELRETVGELKERAIDAQCRSMKYNLIFSGIEEKVWDRNEAAEDAEEVLKNFIKNNLEIEEADDIKMANVHRIGKRNRSSGARPRSIIAKFVHYKDLTKVKRSASKLKGTYYGINEQFPSEIEEKRKSLYPIAKEARKKKEKVVFVRDKLYINDVLYKPPATGVNEDTPTRSPRSKRKRVSNTPQRD